LPFVDYKLSEQALEVMVINDIHEEKIVEVSLEIWDITGEKIWEKKYEKIQVPRDFVSTIDIINLEEVSTKTLSDRILYISVRCDEQEYENYFLFNDFRSMHQVKPELSYIREEDNLVFQCKRPAFGVHIITEEEYVPSDNFFTLVPSVKKRVRCVSNKIKVRSLYDCLNKNFNKQGVEK